MIEGRENEEKRVVMILKKKLPCDNDSLESRYITGLCHNIGSKDGVVYT